MAGFSITGNEGGYSKKSFRRSDPSHLPRRSFADPAQTLAQVRKTKGTGKALAVARAC